MTTTDSARRARRGRRPTVELRPYLTAVLATAYVVGWWAFASRPPKPDASAEAAQSPKEASVASPSPRMAAWYFDLPVERRPPIDLPPGFRIVETAYPAGPTVREAVPVPVRAVPRARRGRVRTRSS